MHSEYYLKKELIKSKQWSLLLDQLNYTAENSKFYRQLFAKNDLNIHEIQDYEAFRKIPIVSKEDLQSYNQDFLAVPENTVIDYVTTSGTIGKPISFMLNEADLERLAINELQSFLMAGVKAEDKVQITTTLDRRFMAGMAYFLGLRKLGAGIIRTGAGLPQLQWESIERFQPKYLIAVPSFLIKMIAYAKENGIDIQNTSIKAAICIGEPLRKMNGELNALGQRIQQNWDIELFSTYASTEMATAFTECKAHKGLHELSDLIFTEILDENQNPVQEGEIGELVVTPLRVRTMPLIRYATGDMLSWTEDGCSCSRNTRRLGPVVGRKQQRLKFKGTTLYPQTITEALHNFQKIDLFMVEAKKDEFENDLVQLVIPSEFESLKEELKDHLKSAIHVTPELKFEEREDIQKLKFPKNSRKPISFRDLR